MLDTLLLDLASVCRQLLPILGALALVYLCILLRHAWKMVDSLTETVKNLDPAVKNVNLSMDKVQAPLDTVVKYSHTLDEAHDAAMDGLHRIADSAAEGVEKMKDAISETLSNNDGYDAVMPYKEPEKKEEA
ncbi:MAG: hypothetical protein IKD66_08965 [Solobacterium sp.]|nr:hypothetical protein [Solobacterium sp.]MBR2769877.1 hypothetical protein [Solobacterium sp.]